MTTITKAFLATSAAAVFAVMATVGVTEASERNARGPSHGSKATVSKQHTGKVGARRFDNNRGRHFSNRGRHHNRSVRRIIPNIVILSGDSGSCSYSYRKWRATGSRYWRARYNDCRNG